MAHNLRQASDGQYSFVGADNNGRMAWHKLGSFQAEPTSASEALVLGKLDWEPLKVPAFHRSVSGEFVPVPDTFLMVCSDTDKVMGAVGSRYEPFANRSAFDFLDTLTNGEMKYRSAGALGNGEKVWLLGEPENSMFEIVSGDPIISRILFTTSHDGSGTIQARDTTETVVCQNTLNIALKASDAILKIKHTRNLQDKLNTAVDMLRHHAKATQDWRLAMEFLASRPITEKTVKEFKNRMFGNPLEMKDGRGKTLTQNRIDAWEELRITGQGADIAGRQGNWYGLLQSFTEYIDWRSQVRGTDDRTESIVFGHGADLKVEAMNLCLDLAAV